MLKNYKLVFLLLVCLISLLLIGCSESQNNNSSTQFQQDYTSQELIEKINEDIQFGMSKDDLVDLEGKKPDLDTTNTNDEDRGIVYIINVNDTQAYLLYYLNKNDDLFMITISLSDEEETYNAYVDNYKTIHSSLEDVYGAPTKNNDHILNKDAKNYGYEVYVGNSSYGSGWDLDNVKIDSFMWKLEDTENIVTQISFQSKEYVGEI